MFDAWKTGLRICAVAGVAAVLSLPAHEAFAQRVPGASETGNRGGILGLMERHADAKRVRNAAYAKMILHPDSTLLVSCFERGLSVSSRLGAIFSDLPPPLSSDQTTYSYSIMPSLGEDLFRGPIYNPLAGLGMRVMPGAAAGTPPAPYTMAHSMAGSLVNVLDVYFGGEAGIQVSSILPPQTPVVPPAPFPTYPAEPADPFWDVDDGWDVSVATLDSFADSLLGRMGVRFFHNTGYDALGTPIPGSIMAYIDLVDTTIVANLQPQLLAVLGPPPTASNAETVRQAWVQMLNDQRASEQNGPYSAINGGIVTYFQSLQALWDEKARLYDALNDAGGPVELFVENVTATGTGVVWTDRAAMTYQAWGGGAGGAPADDCDYAQWIWGGYNGIPGVIAEGMESYMPYMSYNTLLSGGEGSDLMTREIHSHGNALILDEAIRDKNTLLLAPTGPANPVNGLESWRGAPVIAPGSPMNVLITQMP
ncbi:MAG: hypothetical protein OXT65_12755 [Alphaproteobacteria bacterium]|nr:hypothetical protein [Alphaproteobacteria bacterium]